MKCKWYKCENEAREKSIFCSGTCKKRYSRASGTDVPVEVGQQSSGTEVGQAQNETPDVAPGLTKPDKGEQIYPDKLEHYKSNPDMYVGREFPDDMNWDEPMSASELATAGLKRNRVTIPGDWDYKGVCEQVDGVWYVQKQTPDVTKLSNAQLQRELKYKPDTSWVASKEHKGVMHRLSTKSKPTLAKV